MHMSVEEIFYISFSFLYFFPIRTANADFCEFGTCDENSEYCCGENTCCKKKVDVWYFWAAILLLVISVIVLVFFYMRRKRHIRYSDYNLVQQSDIVLAS